MSKALELKSLIKHLLNNKRLTMKSWLTRHEIKAGCGRCCTCGFLVLFLLVVSFALIQMQFGGFKKVTNEIRAKHEALSKLTKLRIDDKKQIVLSQLARDERHDLCWDSVDMLSGSVLRVQDIFWKQGEEIKENKKMLKDHYGHRYHDKKPKYTNPNLK